MQNSIAHAYFIAASVVWANFFAGKISTSSRGAALASLFFQYFGRKR